MRHAYHNAQLLGCVGRIHQLPADIGSEVAFAGRSNSGKSSAINAICQRKALARTSKTPGRTQTINFYTLDPYRRLVDLPGYGYASAPLHVRRHWHKLIEHYLSHRRSLQGLILIMDIRHPLSAIDRQMLDWSRIQRIPVHVVLTKADKLKRSRALQSLRNVMQAIDDEDTGVQIFSATKRLGVSEALEVLNLWLFNTER